MLTIKFTQCDETFAPAGFAAIAMAMPVEPRLRYYEKMCADGKYCATIDELLLLVAQWARRTGQVKELQFVSVCNCGGTRIERVIPTDAEGDMLEEPHHGFFTQRLRYLR